MSDRPPDSPQDPRLPDHDADAAPPPPEYGVPPAYGPATPDHGTPPPAYGYPLDHRNGAQASTPEDRMWGMLAHVSGLLAAWIALGFLGPLLVLLVQGNKSGFIRRHAVEALNFQITLLLAVIVGVALVVVTLGLGLLVVLPAGAVIGVAALIFIIIAAVRANNGEEYRYPMSWRLVK